MKITNDFFIFSESTIIDNEKDSLCIMNVIDGANVKSFPKTLDGFRLSARFTVFDSGNASNAVIKLVLVHPQGESEIIKPENGEYDIDLQPNQHTQRAGLIAELIIDVKSDGPHTIQAFYNEKQIASQVLNVFKRE